VNEFFATEINVGQTQPFIGLHNCSRERKQQQNKRSVRRANHEAAGRYLQSVEDKDEVNVIHFFDRCH
jgi:hypothetical protein